LRENKMGEFSLLKKEGVGVNYVGHFIFTQGS